MQDVVEVLQTAIGMERQGAEFYREAAAQAHDAVVEAVLLALATDEEAHEQVIRKFYDALQRTGEWPAAPADLAAPDPAHERIDEIIQQTAGQIGPDASYMDVYQAARNLEEASYDFYHSNAEKTDDRDAAKFLRFLATIEQTHVDMLEMLLSAVRESMEQQAE